MNPASPDLPTGAAAYMAAARRVLDAVADTQMPAIDAAASLCAEAIRRDGQIFLFGTGHSHMLAEEGHFRAGGLAPVCPILATGLMLHEGALTSTRLERTPGIAAAVLDRYPIGPADVVVVFSNSGVNAVPVEAAETAKAKGAKVIGVIAAAYAAAATPPAGGRPLSAVVDLVIDNRGPPGDALVEIPGSGQRTGPGSTLAAAFILNAVLTETACRLAEAGIRPPVYVSANMPGAQENNAGLIDRYRPRNPHL